MAFGLSYRALKLSIIISALLALVACSQETRRLASASTNVKIIEPALPMAGLNRSRTIRLYLPPDYQTSDRRYPVLYMHDGQNLFDDVTSYVVEWGVDESLDQLFQSKGFGLIVVGIDHGMEKRMSELSPWQNKHIDSAEGEAYMNFVVEQVKPYIDKNYRTLSDVNHTAIMGSSMGGLISHFAIFNYPQIFSKAGIFSPSYWVSDEVFLSSSVDKLAANSRLFFLVGGEEGADVVSQVQRMENQLKAQGLPNERIKKKIEPDGAHNEALWRSAFSEAVYWLFEIN